MGSRSIHTLKLGLMVPSLHSHLGRACLSLGGLFLYRISLGGRIICIPRTEGDRGISTLENTQRVMSHVLKRGGFSEIGMVRDG